MELPLQPLYSPLRSNNHRRTSSNPGSRGHSRSRLTSRDSNALSHHRLNRSPSPTDYWRTARHKKDGISSKVYELNVFIHKGIEKFLDKQAVRDLIIEYDAEDIFIGGVDMFLAADDMIDDLNFSRSEKRRFLDVVDAFSAINNKTGNPDFADRGGNLARANGAGANAAAAAALKNRNKKAAGGGGGARGGLWGKPRTALWTAFFSAIRIKLFHVHHRQKSARRRESDIFSMYP